jgi:hypothetical protein
LDPDAKISKALADRDKTLDWRGCGESRDSRLLFKVMVFDKIGDRSAISGQIHTILTN